MLKKIKKDIDIELNEFLKDTAKTLEPGAIPKLLYDGIKDFLQRNGKRIRPILFFLSYLGYTKKQNFSRKKLLRSALSFELLHDFLLIHDDVIDSSDLRRGKPTLHRFFNTKLKLSKNDKRGADLSIVAGDIIFALAIDVFLTFNENPVQKEKALSMFSGMTASTGIGEYVDVVNDITNIDKIKEKDVLLTYTLKTAKYTFEGPLTIGAALAGINKKEIDKLSKLGIILGEAFQIQDDLLDVFSTSKKTGKPVLSDLNESKKTLLVWKAYKTLKGTDKALLKHILEKNKKTYKDLLKFKNLIIKSKADKYCIKKTVSLLQEAKSICAGLKMKMKYKNVLEQFINNLAS